MPSGGARRRSGPAPDPGSLRQLARTDEWIKLPASGRPGDPPAWPLPRPTLREKALWAKLWSSPQAVEWEQQQIDFEVALYVRRLSEAEVRRSPATLSTLVLRMATSLGLTGDGLRANRWLIVDDQPDAEPAAAAPARKSSRDRLRVVADDGQ